MGLRELIDVAEGFKVFDGVIVHLYGGHIVKDGWRCPPIDLSFCQARSLSITLLRRGFRSKGLYAGRSTSNEHP